MDIRRIAWLLAALAWVASLEASQLELQDVLGGAGRIAPLANGTHLYVPEGPALLTYDVSDPTQPRAVSRHLHPALPAAIAALALHEERLFAVWYGSDARSGGVRIYSVADPARPRLLADVEDYAPGAVFKRPTAVAAAGGWLYLSDSENGVYAAELHDGMPLQFQPTGMALPEDVRLEVRAGELFAIGRTMLSQPFALRIDLSQPAAPRIAAALGPFTQGAFALGDGVLANFGEDLATYELAAALAPPPSAVVALPEPSGQGVFVGDQLWLAGERNLQRYDLRDPAAPARREAIEAPRGLVETLAPAAGGAVLATRLGTAALLQADDSGGGTVASSWTLPGGMAPQQAAFGTDAVFVLDQLSGLVVLDPDTLQEIGRFVSDAPVGFEVFEDIALAGEHVLLANWFAGVAVVDVSDPAVPRQVAAVPIPFASSIVVQDGYAYAGTATNGGSITVIDVADPRTPIVVGVIETPQIETLAAAPGRLFATARTNFAVDGIPSDAFLLEFEIPGKPGNGVPRYVGAYRGCPHTLTHGEALALDAGRARLAMACGDGRMQLLDVSTPGAPRLLSSYAPDAHGDTTVLSGLAVAMDGDYVAYSHLQGVDLVDISDPAAPERLDHHPLSADPLHRMALHDGRLFGFSSRFLRIFSVGAGMPVTAAHSGAWFHPERNGEGWVLEVHAGGRAALYWYTYDEAGGQRWASGVGEVHGNRIEFPSLEAASGARFGDAFDPDDVVRTHAGSARLVFDDCRSGRLDYDAFGQAGSTPLLRITRPDEDCGTFAGSGPRYDGGWFDPARSGEGMALMQVAPGVLGMTWFTYDDAGQPYWVFGTGGLADGEWVLREVAATRGARFGAYFDPADVEHLPWGEVRLVLDCRSAQIRYASGIPAFGSGELSFVRATAVDGTGCED